MLYRGIDLSGNNPPEVWKMVDRYKHHFAFFKASMYKEESGFTLDPTYGYNAKMAEQRGITYSPYHFLDSRWLPKEQGRLFGLLSLLDIGTRAAVDWEAMKKRDGTPFSKPTERDMLLFLEGFVPEAGYYPFVYTGPGYMSDIGVKKLNPEILKCPLWAAAYPDAINVATMLPNTPDEYVYHGFCGFSTPEVWQYTDTSMHVAKHPEAKTLNPLGLDRNKAVSLRAFDPQWLPEAA